MTVEELIAVLNKLPDKKANMRVVITEDNDAMWDIQQLVQDEDGCVSIEAGYKYKKGRK